MKLFNWFERFVIRKAIKGILKKLPLLKKQGAEILEKHADEILDKIKEVIINYLKKFANQ